MVRVTSFTCLCLTLGQSIGLSIRHSNPNPGHVGDAPTVTLRNGSYFGIHLENYGQDIFLGIPYAQPPVGDLRLRIPASLNTSWTGVRNATEYSPACFGYGEDTQIGAGNYCSEDCLTLNVVRPSGHKKGKLPIGVWIHGSVYTFNFASVQLN